MNVCAGAKIIHQPDCTAIRLLFLSLQGVNVVLSLQVEDELDKISMQRPIHTVNRSQSRAATE